jgi:hypothetical protein
MGKHDKEREKGKQLRNKFAAARCTEAFLLPERARSDKGREIKGVRHWLESCTEVACTFFNCIKIYKAAEK